MFFSSLNSLFCIYMVNLLFFLNLNINYVFYIYYFYIISIVSVINAVFLLIYIFILGIIENSILVSYYIFLQISPYLKSFSPYFTLEYNLVHKRFFLIKLSPYMSNHKLSPTLSNN